MTEGHAAKDGTHDRTRIERLSFTTDSGAGDRARLGLLVLESDQTMESEFRTLTDLPGVSVYHARLANEVTVTPDTLAKMERELPVAAGLLPNYLGLKAIGYGCTSGATIIGEDRVAEIIAKAHPDIPSTNPLTAAKAAITALGVKRLGLLTPYSPDVTDAMQSRFDAVGISVQVVGSFYEESDLIVGRIDSDSILQGAISVGSSDNVDGVFISCTSLRAATIIPAAERALNKPVTASNHALAWHLLRLAGIPDTLRGAGCLFEEQLSNAV
ncbi:Asp/Glu racemase [uncultured Ruegeria sp.]|uniref:maleate cis-trans isomerase family protein n=1 Tax=uncultured Ruegeria sp. TaxID=259304 RepID=UPI002639D3D6|nr:Asp/Glu racemase [uncultured Ruegeria sp.]